MKETFKVKGEIRIKLKAKVKKIVNETSQKRSVMN